MTLSMSGGQIGGLIHIHFPSRGKRAGMEKELRKYSEED